MLESVRDDDFFEKIVRAENSGASGLMRYTDGHYRGYHEKYLHRRSTKKFTMHSEYCGKEFRRRHKGKPNRFGSH